MTGSIHQTYDHQAVVSDHHDYYHDPADQVALRNDEGILEEYSEKAAPPPKRKFYKTKKYWIICSINTVIVVVVAVVLALYVIFPKVAQNIMNGSKIDVTSSDISFVKPDALANSVYTKRDDDLNSTFYMSLGSSLSHTGPFSASIKFENPVHVYYNGSLLGDIYFFNETKVSGGHGSLNAVTPFMIKDEAAFTSFSKTMLAVETFTWTLKGRLQITALTRTATVDLNKDITLNGFNSFPKVQITSFQLPGDDPNGGIKVELGTVLTSPSPIGVQLGTIKMAIGYQGVNLGIVTGTGVTLAKGDNNINLSGTLVPQNDTASLAKVSDLFSNYISGKLSNTTAVGLSCAPDGVNPIRWLSQGFETVVLNVGLTAGSPVKIINGISLGYLDLAFNAANPYSPTLSAPGVVANFQMPFGFSIGINQVSQNVSLGINNTDNTATDYFAVMQTPFSPATSNQQNGTIAFALSNTNLAGIPGKESTFNMYNYELTASQNYTFMVSGTADTIATTPIGNVTLKGVNFTVPSTLQGLRFLNSSATTINSLDVVGGTAAGLNLAISVSMENPSDFSINTGDVTFNMGASGTTLGLVTLSNLTLARGLNTVNATSVFDPKSSDVGINLLSTFIMGQANAVDISGNANSTAITSLAAALGNITLSSTLPGLTTALVQGAAISIASNSISTGIVPVKVSIANPFTAGMSISSIVASNTFQGMPVGNINQDISSNPFAIPGKTTGTSQALDMTMNMDPANVALLLRNLAVSGGMDTTALDALLTLGGFSIDGQEQINGNSGTFAGFNIVDYVKQAMQHLSVDLSVTSTVTIGEYSVALTFSQSAVKVNADDSITALIPVVGQTIVQSIVDASVLGFDTIVLSNVGESSFTVQMKGSITNTGPMDATISFPQPLTVHWQGQVLGTVTMADIKAVADVGAQFDVQGTFTVTNGDAMGNFAAYMINNDNFQWEITGSSVSVSALGFNFTGVTLDKLVTLKGASGFKNAVTVNKFDLPANDPSGGITLNVDVSINNPSQIGFNLGGAAFENYFGSVDLGPLASKGAANFAPVSTSRMDMTGRLVPQETKEGIIAITTVFGHYLAGQSSNLTIYGVSGSGNNGPVSWLTKAFKTIKIENVVLPGPATVPTLIPAIDMKNLQLDFTKDQWAPPTSSSDVEAKLQSPFGFPINVVQLDMAVDATFNGSVVASLAVPTEPASTSPSGIITTGFNNIPFKVQDKTLFTTFNYGLTLSPSVTFGLKGTSNALAQTAVGTLTLPGIPFDVETTLGGFNKFGSALTINSLSVSGATASYIIVSLSITLTNPSNITITVGDINFDVKLPSANNAVIGKAYLYNTTISPGAQVYPSEMHLGEGVTDLAGVVALGEILTAYLTGAAVPLLVSGSPTSTKIAPVQPALAALSLSTTMNGNTQGLIQKLHVESTMETVLFEGKATASVTLYNPLDVKFTLKHVYAATYHHFYCDLPGVTDGLTGTEYLVGTVDYTLPEPVTIPPKGTVVATGWPVTLNGDINNPFFVPISVAASMADGYFFFNVTQNATVTVGDSFEVSNMYYSQKEVPYDIVIPTLSDQPLSEIQGQVCPNMIGVFVPTTASLNTTTNSTSNATSTVSATSTVTLTSIDPSSSTTVTTTDASSTTTTVPPVTTNTSAATSTTAATSSSTSSVEAAATSV